MRYGGETEKALRLNEERARKKGKEVRSHILDEKPALTNDVQEELWSIYCHLNAGRPTGLGFSRIPASEVEVMTRYFDWDFVELLEVIHVLDNVAAEHFAEQG